MRRRYLRYLQPILFLLYAATASAEFPGNPHDFSEQDWAAYKRSEIPLSGPHGVRGNVNCLTCHVLHGALGPKLTAYETINNLCKSCHYEAGPASNLETHRNETCTICHNPHWEEQKGFIRSQVETPSSGLRDVTFTGADFVRGAPFYDGICEVCHTQAAYHRNDSSGDHTHNAGIPCVDCHDHANGGGGFSGGMGDGAHPTHLTQVNGPELICSDCHINPPILLNATVLETTAICDNCHSADGVATAKAYWHQDPGTWVGIEGEASFCGSCHDATPGNTRMDGSGDSALNILGDESTYGFYVTGHGRASGNYQKLSWQEAAASGNPPADKPCGSCHGLTLQHFGNPADRLKPGYENDVDNSTCNQCHAGTEQDPQFYTTYGAFQNSAHRSLKCTGCHDVHGTAGTFAGMTTAHQELLCYQCHTEGVIQDDALANNRPGGYVSANDIEEAFGKSRKHDLGTSFSLSGKSYTLECISCHNVHLVNGGYWEAEDGDKTPITRFPPGGNLEPWGDGSGEKMDDFAARASGTGGWYYSTARGGFMAWNQPGKYQPPRSGNGYSFEFGGDVLPDYTTFCLDCHSSRMSDANPAVNWGQGIGCTDNSVDPPNQRIECGAQHGLNAANTPSFITDSGTPGFWSAAGNPDVLFDMNYVTRGRHTGHFMRWPYDSAERASGINFVMSCTDCHEAHGSNRGGMVRERFNVNANGDCGTGGNANPDGENCNDGGNWNSFCNACHYYYGGQHAGMSCGNASCHEVNSPHRIIHSGGGGGTQLMLTAAGYESSYQKPDFTPDIVTAEGHIGSDQITVTFADSAWSGDNLTGSLDKDDFWLFDGSGNETRTVTDVVHTGGEATAVLTMSAPLAAQDLNSFTLAARPASIWSWYAGGYMNWATGTIGAQAVSAGPWPVAATGPPPVAIASVEGRAGSDQLLLTFSEAVYTSPGRSGALLPGDFALADVSGDGNKAITGITHAEGTANVIITLNSPLIAGDIDTDTFAAAANSIYDAFDNPVGTNPVTISETSWPAWGATFQLDEPAASATASDETNLLYGPVSTPAVSLPGDGYFHGDETQQTAIDITSDSTALKQAREFTVEARVYTNVVDLDYLDDNGDGLDDDYDFDGDAFTELPGGRNATSQRIAERKKTFQFTIFRANYAGDYVSSRAGKARVILKYFADSASRHTCPHPQWPDDDYVGNDVSYHQISTYIDSYGLVQGHWYLIRAVFNSNKAGAPVDIFIDDQGEDGNGLNENWAGYRNASKTINESSSCKWGALPGDFLATADQKFYIGDNVNHTNDIPGNKNNGRFKGLIDWVTWKPVADYSGVDDPPR